MATRDGPREPLESPCRIALLASEDRKKRDEQRERMALLAARIRAGTLPRAAEHADEVERSRTEDWKR